MAALLGVSAVSCTDGNDWEVDGSHSRLFGLNDSKLSIEAEDVQATLTFTGTPNAEYYIIEVSTDSLYDDVPMGGGNAIVYGEDRSMTKSPAVLTGLYGDTRYYLRIKAMADGISESKWSYYKSGSTFRTLAEQIFNPVTESDRFEDRIHLSWQPGAEVTNIAVTLGEDVIQTIVLDDAAKASGEYVVTGLAPSTTYTFTIYNGESKRGLLTISTTAAMPEGDYKIELPAGTTLIDQTLIDQIAADAQAAVGNSVVSVTIGIPANSKVNVNGTSEDGSTTTIKLPEGVSVTFFGMSGGEKPVLNFPRSLDIGGGRTYIRFENVAIVDGGCQYLVNQSSDSNLGELSFTQCTIGNFERSLIRTQGSGVINIENVIVDDCVVTNMATGNGYSIFYFGTETTNVDRLELKNSTFDTSQRSFIEASKAPITNGVFITNCTFYNNVQDGRYFMDANGQTTDLTVMNTIFGKSYVETARGVRTSGTTLYESCLRTSDCVYSANDIKELEPSDMSSSDIFKDPDNHDFTLKINENIGDPRWYVFD